MWEVDAGKLSKGPSVIAEGADCESTDTGALRITGARPVRAGHVYRHVEGLIDTVR